MLGFCHSLVPLLMVAMEVHLRSAGTGGFADDRFVDVCRRKLVIEVPTQRQAGGGRLEAGGL